MEKVLTLSALLDTGKVNARTKMLVPGELHRQDRVIHDHWDHGLIKLTLAGVLAKSSNVGTVLASDQFGPGELRSYLAKFGLGQPTDVGLRRRVARQPARPERVVQPDRARIAFGQSLSVNALQMAAAVNTLANGGVRVDPTLIQGEATRDDGMEIGTDVSTTRRVVSAKAARQTTQMMERVVDPGRRRGAAGQRPGLPGGRQDRYRPAGRHLRHRRGQAQLLRRHQRGLLRRLRPGRQPAVHRLRRHPGTEDRGRGRWHHGRPRVPKLMGFTLQRYGVPPSDRKQTVLPVEW